jgi:hypothetical protein
VEADLLKESPPPQPACTIMQANSASTKARILVEMSFFIRDFSSHGKSW